jgi:hypothetical protein
MEVKTQVPQTLFSLDDVVVAMHWVADTTERLFRHQEKLYVHEEKSILSGETRYIEAFVMNNILREYPFHKRGGYGTRRFHLYADSASVDPFGFYETLAEALPALLVADAKVSIEAQWRARFGG